jgi:outer membrane immunogenic protein
MKNFLVVAVAAAALCGAPALAADMPQPAPVYKAAPAPVFNWTGIYVGGTAGYGWGESQMCDFSGACTPHYNIDGFVGGGTLGYNWQAMGSPWVFGLETDMSYAHVRGVQPSVVGFGCASGCETDVDWFGTVRGRLGAAYGQFLPYVTGGFAYAGLKGALIGSSSGSETKTTWTVGAGIEYALTANWSTKIEYLFFDKFGDFNVGSCVVSCFPHDTNMNVVRAGLNYRFATH